MDTLDKPIIKLKKLNRTMKWVYGIKIIRNYKSLINLIENILCDSLNLNNFYFNAYTRCRDITY